jgi:hypothetical protein
MWVVHKVYDFCFPGVEGRYSQGDIWWMIHSQTLADICVYIYMQYMIAYMYTHKHMYAHLHSNLKICTSNEFFIVFFQRKRF